MSFQQPRNNVSGPPMAGLLAESIGWRPVFGISAVIALAAGVAVKLGIRPKPGIVRPPFSLAQMNANYRLILRNPMAVYCYGAVAAEGCFIFGFLPYVAALLESRGAGGVRMPGSSSACAAAVGRAWLVAGTCASRGHDAAATAMPSCQRVAGPPEVSPCSREKSASAVSV